MKEALLFAQLAINLVSAAPFLSAKLINPTHVPALDEFRRFPKEGSSLSQNMDQDIINGLFVRKKKMDEGPLEEESLSADELDLTFGKRRRGSVAKRELEVVLRKLSLGQFLD